MWTSALMFRRKNSNARMKRVRLQGKAVLSWFQRKVLCGETVKCKDKGRQLHRGLARAHTLSGYECQNGDAGRAATSHSTVPEIAKWSFWRPIKFLIKSCYFILLLLFHSTSNFNLLFIWNLHYLENIISLNKF